MSLANVLRLEDYRGKKAYRLRLAERLHRADPRRLAIFQHLTEISELCDADRTATVWVDEYGAGSVHPHVVLDQLADRPRRIFSAEPLRRAWDLGVPGAIDTVAEAASSVPTTLAISLGSDGMRAWFLVAESTAGRSLLRPRVRDRLMFLAGECAAVLLHQELDEMLQDEGQPETAPGFAGWAILSDLEGREADEEVGKRIAQRFVVGRVVRMLVDDDLVIVPERITEQVRRARIELPEVWESDDAEPALWHGVLDSAAAGDLEGLAEALVALGQAVEKQEHAHGALELYECAYAVACAVAVARPAAEASWYSGRVLRRRAAWDESEERYRRAHDIAEISGLSDILVHVLVGLATMKQDLGNLPAARRGLEKALAAAEAAGDRDSIAVVHHSYLGLEQVAGDLKKGLEHGWIAVATYESPERQTQCIASLAAALIDFGDREAAEDAWSLVAQSTSDNYYLIYAHDALAHLAALRGDKETFHRHAARCDSLGWERGSSSARAEILYYRGLSYGALGMLNQAEAWLRRAIAYMEEHKFNRLLFEAEAALGSLSASRQSRQTTAAPAAPTELRVGLRTMRQELVGAGG